MNAGYRERIDKKSDEIQDSPSFVNESLEIRCVGNKKEALHVDHWCNDWLDLCEVLQGAITQGALEERNGTGQEVTILK
jgi:hypothetical protein